MTGRMTTMGFGFVFVGFAVASASADFITFEGVAAPMGAVIPVAPYVEGNFLVSATSDNNGIFSASNNGNSAGFSSDFFGWDNTIDSPEITITELSGRSFSLKRIEIGDLFGEGPSEVTFVGNFSSGGTITETFSGITTATFVTPLGFNNLSSLEISAGFDRDAAIDNISLNIVPEPSAAIIAWIGLSPLLMRRRQWRSRE